MDDFSPLTQNLSEIPPMGTLGGKSREPVNSFRFAQLRKEDILKQNIHFSTVNQAPLAGKPGTWNATLKAGRRRRMFAPCTIQLTTFQVGSLVSGWCGQGTQLSWAYLPGGELGGDGMSLQAGGRAGRRHPLQQPGQKEQRRHQKGRELHGWDRDILLCHKWSVFYQLSSINWPWAVSASASC